MLILKGSISREIDERRLAEFQAKGFEPAAKKPAEGKKEKKEPKK